MAHGGPWWSLGGSGAMWTEHDATGASLSVIRDSYLLPVELKGARRVVEATAEEVTVILVIERTP